MHIIVVGGGVVGVSTAFSLLLRGHTVELFEARKAVAEETSHANGGMLTAGMSEPWNAPGVWKDLIASFTDPHSPMKLHASAIPGLAVWGLKFLAESRVKRFESNTKNSYQLCRYSIQKTNAWVKSFDLDCDYRSHCDKSSDVPTGDLKIFESEAAAQSSIAIAETLKPLGLRAMKVDRDQAIELEPALRPIAEKVHCGLYFPDDTSGDAARFTTELAKRFVAQGGTLHTGTPVLSLLRDGTSIEGVATTTGDVSADVVVVAAASASTRLLKPLGVRLPVKPVKGYSLTLDAQGIQGAPRIPVINHAMHAAVNPLGQRIRVAGTAEFTATTKPTLSPARIDNLKLLLESTYPELACQLDYNSAKPWCGFRPMSADGKPFIGSTAQEGLYVNCGHGYLGWTQAAGSAELLADIVEGKAAEIDSAPFSIGPYRQ